MKRTSQSTAERTFWAKINRFDHVKMKILAVSDKMKTECTGKILTYDREEVKILKCS
jgi:hypothetical protein